MWNISYHSESRSPTYRTCNRIKPYLLKIFSIRLRTNPVISQKHHCFSSIFMNYIYKFFCFLCYKFLNKVYIIKILLCRYSESCIIVSLVYNVLCPQPVSSRFCKCFKCRNRNTCSISKPFYKFFFSKIIKYQRKMIKKCCKSDYISIRIFLQPFFQIITHKNI